MTGSHSRNVGSSRCPLVPSPYLGPSRPCDRLLGTCHREWSLRPADRPRSSPDDPFRSHHHHHHLIWERHPVLCMIRVGRPIHLRCKCNTKLSCFSVRNPKVCSFKTRSRLNCFDNYLQMCICKSQRLGRFNQTSSLTQACNKKDILVT